jgi:hypothetical protein
MAVTPYQMPNLAAFNRPIADPNSQQKLQAYQNYVSGLLTDPMARAEFGTGLLQGTTTDLASLPVDVYSGAVNLAQAVTPQNAPQNRFFMTNPFYMLSQSGDLAEQASSVAGSEALGEAVYGKPQEGYAKYRDPARIVGGLTGGGELLLGKASAKVAPYIGDAVNYLTDAMPKPQVATPEGLLMDAPQQAQSQPQTLLMEAKSDDLPRFIAGLPSSISNPKTIAKLAKANGFSDIKTEDISGIVKDIKGKQKERELSRSSVDPLIVSKRTRGDRAKRLSSNKRVDQIHNGMWSKPFADDVKLSIGDRFLRVDAINKANMEAVPRQLRKEGWTVRYASTDRSGKKSSRYLVSPDGSYEVRLSDHYLPDTAQRRYNQSTFGTRYDDEIILGGNESPQDIIDEIKQLASEAM